MKRQSYTQEEILAALKACARKLGRNPNLRELSAMTGITEKILWRRFGGLRTALDAAGLEAAGSGFRADEATLLLDWAAVARKLGRAPSVSEYRRAGAYSETPFHRRYGSWNGVGRGFRELVEKDGNGLRRKWRDVLKMVPPQPAQNRRCPGTPVVASEERRPAERAWRSEGSRRSAGMYLDRPTYGRPLLLEEMAYAPVNEMGVVYLFGALARRLGFVVHRIQGRYPDCIAMRETAPGVWQRVRIEFEYDSRNFLKHRHRPGGCDVIVCWKHGWKDVPEGIEVVELSKVIG